MVVLDSDNSYNELGPNFSKNAWWGIVIADYMKDIETSLRTCAVDPAVAIARYDELWHELTAVAERDITEIIPTLQRMAGEISKIPLKRKLTECPKVLIVGEIYVRRDDFAVDEMVRLLSKKGIVGKVSGVSEWIYYCDYMRKHEIKKLLKLEPLHRKLFSKAFRDYISWKIEMIYKHNVDRKIKNILKTTGLIPATPHNMEKIMGNAVNHFVTDDLYSEISISSGVASTAMFEDYSGIINISPFACLIGRVIEGLLTPWARKRKYPVMSVEIDGNILPPAIINNLEIFMLNVLRFRNSPDAMDLVEKEGSVDTSLNRTAVRKKVKEMVNNGKNIGTHLTFLLLTFSDFWNFS